MGNFEVALTSIGPCIVIYYFSTTNKMHLFLKLFILVKRSAFGRSFRPSSGAQNCTYSNKHMSNSCCYLLLTASTSSCLTYACAVLSSWWWTERPSETRRAFYKNKQFEKQLHLVGCSRRIYYHARTYKRQKYYMKYLLFNVSYWLPCSKLSVTLLTDL